MFSFLVTLPCSCNTLATKVLFCFVWWLSLSFSFPLSGKDSGKSSISDPSRSTLEWYNKIILVIFVKVKLCSNNNRIFCAPTPKNQAWKMRSDLHTLKFLYSGRIYAMMGCSIIYYVTPMLLPYLRASLLYPYPFKDMCICDSVCIYTTENAI